MGAISWQVQNLLLFVLWTCLHLQPFFLLFLLLGKKCSLPLWMELFSTSSVGPICSCLLRVFVDYSFFILFSYRYLSTDCFLSTCKYYYILQTSSSSDLLLPFSFPSQPHIFIGSSLPGLHLLLCSSNPLHSSKLLSQHSIKNCYASLNLADTSSG